MKSASKDGCGCFPTGRHYPGIAHLMRVAAEGVAEEFEASSNWRDLPIAVIDTETTGRSAVDDRVIELGIVLGQGGNVGKHYNWLINPGRPIPAEATAVHGITDDDIKDCPTFEALLPEIWEALQGSVPAAYNANFDRQFLLEEIKRCAKVPSSPPPAFRPKVEWIDPLVWAREIQKKEKSKALGAVAERLGVSLEGAHRANNDAEATLKVFYLLGNDERMPALYGALMQEQRRLGREQEAQFARWRKR